MRRWRRPTTASASTDSTHRRPRRAINDWLEAQGLGEPTVTYKLRDWLFSRQRYWGEPFPIVYDDDGAPRAVPESMLPVELPELTDFAPTVLADDDADTEPEPPLARAADWAVVELDLGDGPKQYRRETNTMPQWAGSCWYYLRYLDPENDDALIDPEVEQYWMPTKGVDLYVGGVEHAVLHLLYARFWHKVLYDLGHVSTIEPFGRLFNQGYIQAHAYTDERGVYVEAADVVERDGAVLGRRSAGASRVREDGQEPEERRHARRHVPRLRRRHVAVVRDVHGPARREPAVEYRRRFRCAPFLAAALAQRDRRRHRHVHVDDAPADDETRRVLHRTIAAVGADMAELKFNTAIARLFECNNRLTQVVAERGNAPREVVVPLLLMLAPLTPHIAEELWARLGNTESLAYEPFPEADPAYLAVDDVEVAVQINGKLLVAGADGHRRVGGRSRSRGPGRHQGRGCTRRQDGAQGNRGARTHRQLRGRLISSSFLPRTSS